MALPLFVAWLPGSLSGEMAIVLLPGVTGAAIGLYTTGVRSTGSYFPTPHPGFATNLLFVTGVLVITASVMVLAGVICPLALLALDPPMDGGAINAVVLLSIPIALPAVGAVITGAYWIVDSIIEGHCAGDAPG